MMGQQQISYPERGGYDVHCHYFPGSMPRWAEKFGNYHPFFWLDRKKRPGCAHCAWMMKGTEKFRSLADSRLWEPEAYLEQRQSQGIDVMALSPTPQNFYYDAKPAHTLEIARYQNDEIAGLQQRFPGSFCGLGTVPLQDTELACEELIRCKQSLGLAGVEIATSCQGLDLADPRFLPFFETAEKTAACVFVHPWYMPSPDRLQPPGVDRSGWGNWLLGMPSETAIAMFRLCLSGLIKKLPGLRIGFAHGGGSFAFLLDRMKHGAAVRPEYFPADIDFELFSKSVYYDSHTCSTATLRFLIETVGADRIMAGSDWPYPLGESDVRASVQGIGNDEALTRILCSTPRTFLGLS